MEEILHQLMSSLSHYLQGFIYISFVSIHFHSSTRIVNLTNQKKNAATKTWMILDEPKKDYKTYYHWTFQKKSPEGPWWVVVGVHDPALHLDPALDNSKKHAGLGSFF